MKNSPLGSALRGFAVRPGLTVARVLQVAMLAAVGASVFAVADATLLRPLSLPESSRLARITMWPPGVTTASGGTPLQVLTYLRFREQGPFEFFEGTWLRERALGGENEPESVAAVSASPSVLSLLGADLSAGRVFDEQETLANARVAVLSHGLWLRRFGGSSDALGKTVLIDGDAYQVIGVLSGRFAPKFLQADVWTPLYINPADRVNRLTYIQTLARLKEGVTFSRAQAEMTSGLRLVALEAPEVVRDWSVTVRPLQEDLFGEQKPAVLLLLLAVVALAFLATANLANLTLADVLSRQRQFATRIALGASTTAIVLPEVVRSVLIALFSGSAGLALAYAALPGLLSLKGDALASAGIGIDWRVVGTILLFAAIVMTTSAVAPLRRIVRADVQTLLVRDGRSGTGSHEAIRTRTLLLAAQTALGVMLLSLGATVVSAFVRTSRVDVGFEAVGLTAAQLRLPERTYPTVAARAAFADQILERLEALPMAAAVAAAGTSLIPNFAYFTLAEVEQGPRASESPQTLLFRRVSAGYFETMGIETLAGRSFDRRDGPSGQPAAIVNTAFARRFWPGESPLGQRVRRATANPQWLTVVGVVDDAFENGLGRAPGETLYVPFAQNNTSGVPLTLFVRGIDGRQVGASEIAAAVHAVDPMQPLAKVMPMSGFMERSLAAQSFRTVLLAGLGGLALFISVLGAYAVASRNIVERTREIGVRLALGQTRGGVWRTMASHSLRAVLYGAGVGILAALVGARVLTSLIPDVGAESSVPIACAVILLVGIAGVASFLASARAVRLGPLDAMRAGASD